MSRRLDTMKARTGEIHVTVNHTGKMAGIHSVSTSVLKNDLCKARREKGENICSHCFAAAMMKRYASMQAAFSRNYEIMNGHILTEEEIPVFTSFLGRGESFGDFASWTAAANMIQIAKFNPLTSFAVWTKNPGYFAEAIKRGYEKPENMQLVLSSVQVNKALDPERIATVFPFIDKIFTVYDPSFIQGHNVEINCGARSCITCQRCYRKNPDGVKIMMVSEKLK